MRSTGSRDEGGQVRPALLDGEARSPLGIQSALSQARARRATRQRRLRILLEAAIVLGVAFAAAVATTWPLALRLGSLPLDRFDGPFQAWTIDHVQWALTRRAPLWDANIFAPNRHTLAYSDSLIGIAVPLLPLRWLGLNPIAQLNLALLLGITASAGAGYLFGRVVSGQRATGAITAAAFAFGPFGTVSATHLHAAVHPGVALAATGAWWLADRSERDGNLFPPVALLVGSVVWQMSVSFYPGAYAVAAVLIVLVIRWRDLRRRGVLMIIAGLAVCAVVTLLLAIPNLQVFAEGRHFVRSPEEVANLGVDFTGVQSRLVVWGPVLGEGRVSVPAFPGLVLLLLSGVGLVDGLRATGRCRRTAMTGVAFVAIGAFMALGTAAHGWRAYSPYRLLFEFVPGFKIIRAASRAWILGLLGLGLLSGIGCSALGRWMAGRRPTRGIAVVTVLAVLGVLVEGFASRPDRPHISVSEADQALAAEPRPGGVLYLPALSPGGLVGVQATFRQAENVYGTTAHHRRTPNGYSGFTPREFPALSSRMRKLPSSSTLHELRSLDVRFVVVRSWARGTPWERLLEPSQATPLQFLGRYGEDLLYEVPSRH
jgi:hypothetical protein